MSALSTVAQLRPASEHLLTKQQLAAHLQRSPRWIELRVREGMPSEAPTRRYPQRRFRLSEVEAWLASGDRQPQPADRLSQLEEQIASLSATVKRLEQRIR